MADHCVLLVEGRTDQYIFSRLFEHHRIPYEFFRDQYLNEGVVTIRDMEGIEKLLDTLSLYLEIGEPQRVGIIVDADTPLAARWQSVHNILTNSEYSEVPAVPDRQGTIIVQEGKQRVGIWIMPDNSLDGMLEHFIGLLVHPDDRLWLRARRSVSRIPSEERRFPEVHRVKAEIHTWLAWQEEPGVSMGMAIVKGYLDADAPHARRFTSWIRRLIHG